MFVFLFVKPTIVLYEMIFYDDQERVKSSGV